MDGMGYPMALCSHKTHLVWWKTSSQIGLEIHRPMQTPADSKGRVRAEAVTPFTPVNKNQRQATTINNHHLIINSVTIKTKWAPWPWLTWLTWLPHLSTTPFFRVRSMASSHDRQYDKCWTSLKCWAFAMGIYLCLLWCEWEMYLRMWYLGLSRNGELKLERGNFKRKQGNNTSKKPLCPWSSKSKRPFWQRGTWAKC